MAAFLRLLGGVRLEAEDLALSGRAMHKKRLALLALLATSASGRSSRDKLTGYLWPEIDTEAARHQLASALYELRKALGEDAIVSAGDDVVLNRGAIRSDVAELDASVAAGDWVRVAEIYGGPFLDGFFVPDAAELELWITAERRRLALSYAKALEEVAAERARRGDTLGAVEWWRKLAAHDLYNSRVALRLMEALDQAGDRTGALQHARIHSEVVRGELGVDPDPKVTALAERLRANPAAPRAAAPSGASTPNGPLVRTAPLQDSTSRLASSFPGMREESSPGAAVEEVALRGRQRAMIGLGIGLALAVLAAIAGQDGVLRRLGLATPGRAHVMPVVLMMDSPAPARVYDEEVLQASGTNADVINDLLRDLPVQRVKETAGPYWHRHEEIRQLHPDLILIHLSAFCAAQCEPHRIKMRTFIEYLADTDAQFLIYSRLPPDSLALALDDMLGDLPQRFPALRSRIHVFATPVHGTPHWKDPATAAAFKLEAKGLLRLK